MIGGLALELSPSAISPMQSEEAQGFNDASEASNLPEVYFALLAGISTSQPLKTHIS